MTLFSTNGSVSCVVHVLKPKGQEKGTKCSSVMRTICYELPLDPYACPLGSRIFQFVNALCLFSLDDCLLEMCMMSSLFFNAGMLLVNCAIHILEPKGQD